MKGVNMNFSDYSKQEIKKESKINKSAEVNIKQTYEELKNLDNDALSKRLFEEVATQKRDGTFNYEMLKNNIEAISPLIPQRTYENLKKLLETIK